MNHVIDKLEAWLANELSAEESNAVQLHLESCSDCATHAQELRQVWALLGTMDEGDSTRASIWPNVRSRTVGLEDGRQASDWLFGGGQALRAGLATTALAAGLALAFLLPAGEQSVVNTNVVAGLDENSDMEWLNDSTVFGSDSGGLLDQLWLGTGLENEGDGS